MNRSSDRGAAQARGPGRGAADVLAILLTLGGLGWATGLYRTLGLQIYNEQFFAPMLAMGIALAFLHLPIRRGTPRGALPWYDGLAALAALAAGGYMTWEYPRLVDLVLLRPLDAVIVGTVLIVLVIEALRRATGNALVIILVAFLLYALLGNHVPGPLQGRAQDWERLAGYLAFDVNGLMGVPIRVATTIVVAFILFGLLLSVTGGSGFFTDLAAAAMGRYRGGAAKIAVAGSALFGSISGSAVANVVATGVITIPMMKKGGFPAHKAGALEAVASTGGQLMPPVMGAAAFLMADFLQIDYADVVLAALVPAILYYVALFIQADLDAARAGISAVDEALIPRLRAVMRAGWFFPLPFAMLLIALFVWNEQPERAVMWSIVVLLGAAFAFGYRGKRPTLRDLFNSVRGTGYAILDIVLITGAAGIIIGVLSITGLGFSLAEQLTSIGQSSLPLLLLLTALVCIVLGMGSPTLGVYVLLATLVAPALVRLGIEPLAAHLYVLYFGMMSMITPPVAVAAFAAASVAEADAMRTGWVAMRFGWPAYVVPVLFVLSPSLLLIGNGWMVAFAILTAVIGVWLICIGFAGYFLRPMAWPVRILFGLAGLATLIPASAFAQAIYTDVFGLAAGGLLLAREFVSARKVARTVGTAS